METTEKVVESYCRYVKGWLTIPNLKCKGQYEIDLLAVDTTRPRKFRRYHIESGVSISGSFSKLTTKDFSPEDLKIRVKQAGQRRSLGYFIHRKFDLPEVKAELRKYGFVDGNYSKIVVTWGWQPEAKEVADREGIQLGIFVISFRRSLVRVAITRPISRTIPLELYSSMQKQLLMNHGEHNEALAADRNQRVSHRQLTARCRCRPAAEFGVGLLLGLLTLFGLNYLVNWIGDPHHEQRRVRQENGFYP